MADIDRERKRSGGWLWALIGLILLALLVWWLWPGGGADDELYNDPDASLVEPANELDQAQPMPQGEATIASVMAAPESYVGQQFPAGEVRVAEVPTDRGFWIESGGSRLFAVLIDEPEEAPVDIQAGQTLRLDGGTIRDTTSLGDLQGGMLDADTERLVREQRAFLVVNESAIQVQSAQQ